MIKAIVFDCFGVLAYDGWTPFKRKYIKPGSEVAKMITHLGGRTDLGKLGHEDMIAEISRLAGTNPDELREAIESRVPNEELIAYIKAELKPKYKIGLITNASYDVLKNLFTEDQKTIFDATVLSYESKMMKPDPKMYELAAKRLSADITECLFIDDQERHINGARKAGAPAILFTSLKDLPGALKPFLGV